LGGKNDRTAVLNIPFSGVFLDYVDIAGGSTIGIQWAKVAIFNLYTRKYLEKISNTATVNISHQ